jgi:hypothetical protein
MRSFLLAVSMLSSTLAFAQPDPQTAGTLFDEGRALLEAGNGKDACEKFEASFKLDPAAGTMLNLGLCNEAQRKLATAVKWFRRAQTAAAENQLAETEAAAKDKTAVLAPKVPTLKLDVSVPTGSQPTVLLDGVKLDNIEWGRVEVDAGHHTLELSAPPNRGVQQTIDAENGAPTVVVTLVIKPPPPPPRFEIIDLGKAQRRRAITAGVLGAGLIITAGAVSAIGKHEYDQGEVPADWDRWKNLVRYGATPVFLGGAALLTYAVVLRARAPGKERRQIAAPILTPTQVGFAFVNSF